MSTESLGGGNIQTSQGNGSMPTTRGVNAALTARSVGAREQTLFQGEGGGCTKRGISGHPEWGKGHRR